MGTSQQNPKYLIIGNGRMAKHMTYYLGSLGLSFATWSRQFNQTNTLLTLTQECSHALVLINDSAIEPFIQQHVFLEKMTLVHFSGALTTRLASSTHPLFTFTQDLYPLETYGKIPFFLTEASAPFESLLPGLPNPHHRIQEELKAYYHSLCVLSANFTTILWQKFFQELENRFKIPHSVAFPYLEQTLKNLQEQPITALTGPLARRDHKTIQENIKALQGDPFQTVYYAFLASFRNTQEMGEGHVSTQNHFRFPKNEGSQIQNIDGYLL